MYVFGSIRMISNVLGQNKDRFEFLMSRRIVWYIALKNLEKNFMNVTVHHRLHEEDGGFHRAPPCCYSTRVLALVQDMKNTVHALVTFESSVRYYQRAFLFFHFNYHCPKRCRFEGAP